MLPSICQLLSLVWLHAPHVHLQAQGLQKLGVDALAFDYPLGPSKGYATRVVLLSRKGSAHDPCLFFQNAISRIRPRLAWLADFILKAPCFKPRREFFL